MTPTSPKPDLHPSRRSHGVRRLQGPTDGAASRSSGPPPPPRAVGGARHRPLGHHRRLRGAPQVPAPRRERQAPGEPPGARRSLPRPLPRHHGRSLRACKVEPGLAAGADGGTFGQGQMSAMPASRKKRVEGMPSNNLMAEHRHRKRLNDRLSMLRSVVPKISKMDRTSILGDTIDYMKELLERIRRLHEEMDIPEFEVERKEGEEGDTRVEIYCAAMPGLLVSTVSTLDTLGLDIQQCIVSCFNDYAMHASCSEMQREMMSADAVKQELFKNAGYGGSCLLGVGEGKEINLEDHCPRWKLLQQCIRYLGPREMEFYEVTIENKMMMYRLSRKIVDTSEGPKDAKWIFVLSTTKIMYIGSKSKGTFQHSSFLAGGATFAAGRLVLANGILKAVWPHSGHYRPTEANFQEFMKYLRKRNVDLTDVKLSPTEGEEDEWLRSSLSQMDLSAMVLLPLLIYGFKLGITGAAISTVAS
ncbi:IQ domain-containing protein IQM2-like [Hordeum vulgare]|nr:IQ domain-containing protein IQM2-like [Hordeum vulgare]